MSAARICLLATLVATATTLLGCRQPAPNESALGASAGGKGSAADGVAQEIVKSCPAGKPDDLGERDECGKKLAESTILRDALVNPFLWGGQLADGEYDISKSKTTRLNSLVYRRMYLSTFMFSGTYTVQTHNGKTVIHLPATFRYALDVGEYPYPFWHRQTKWESYEKTTEVLLFVEGQSVIGGLRSAVEDPNRPVKDHQWDKKWTWVDSGGKPQPRVSLYAYLFPTLDVSEVDEAYRNLESRLRPYRCLSCHSPDNISNQNPLELFNYPNQAISARHRLVNALETTQMPPGEEIPEEELQEIIALARKFEAAGDKVLSAVGEATTESKILALPSTAEPLHVPRKRR